MLRTLASALVAFFVATTAALAADRGPAVPDYEAEQVAPKTYVIHGPLGYPNPENQGFMNNPAFVLTDAGVVVVDPGSSVQTGAMVLRQVREVTDAPVAAVLNTHVHGDHWLGNQAIRKADPEVPIYGHPNMIRAIEEGAGLRWVDNMKAMTEGATAGTRVVGPNHEVADGDTLEIGGTTFRFHHPGPAHTNTDVMIEVAKEDLLFLGDNACNERIVRMDDGTFTGSVEVLEAAREVDAEVLVPGHGQTGGWEIVDAYQAYLEGLYGAVAEYYDQGMMDYEMKPKVRERLARFEDWSGFEEELGKHISLAMLEYEQKMFE
ncbi:MAG TPA: MBL fold metallo-hydrolase [Gammaproteobacteria bacterium]|nr:MBL fold metallo-hydrolase [Gammaproteobacteria bacterium]